MPDMNRDFDLDDAFKHTSFVPDPSFKEALRGRLQHARDTSSQPTAFSSNGWRRSLNVQPKRHTRLEEHTMQPTRLLPAFGALMLIILIGALIVGVFLPGGLMIARPPIVEPTSTPTQEPSPTPTAVPATAEPTALPAEFTADELADLAGIWSRAHAAGPQMFQFNVDGTAYIDWATQQNGDYLEVISTSPDGSEFAYQFTVWFEDGVLHVQNLGGWHDTRTQQYHGMFTVTISTDGTTPTFVTFVGANDEARNFRAWTDQPWAWVGAIAPAE